MVYECPVCKAKPGSHSLRRLADQDGKAIFYTRPAEATKYWDLPGILDHYDGTLGEYMGPWIWVFDAAGFSWTHALQFDVAIGIAKLITQKYSATLEAIRIINPTPLVNFVRRIIWPFLNKKLKALLE
jgi:hypothetical protein